MSHTPLPRHPFEFATVPPHHSVPAGRQLVKIDTYVPLSEDLRKLLTMDEAREKELLELLNRAWNSGVEHAKAVAFLQINSI